MLFCIVIVYKFIRIAHSFAMINILLIYLIIVNYLVIFLYWKHNQ